MKSDTFPTPGIILAACIFIIIATHAKICDSSIQTTFHHVHGPTQAQKQLSQSKSRINPTCILNCAQCVKIYGDYFDGYACAQTCKLFTPLKKSVREPVNYYYPWAKREVAAGGRAVKILDNEQEPEPEYDDYGDFEGPTPKIDCTDITTIGRFIRN